MIDARSLWTAVLEQAIIDLTNANKRYFTQLWFTSDNHAPGSFLWICDNLDLDPSWFRRRLFALVDAAPVSSRPRWYRKKKRLAGTNGFHNSPRINDRDVTRVAILWSRGIVIRALKVIGGLRPCHPKPYSAYSP
jgi:hypothetical protein